MAARLRVCLSLWLASVATAPAFAGEAQENRLDTELKLLYRSLRAERGAASASADDSVRPGGAARPASEPPSRQRALELVGRVRGQATPARERDGAASASEPRLTLLVQSAGEASALEGLGFRVQGRLGAVFTGTLPASRLVDLAEQPDVVFVQASHRLQAQLPLPAAAAPHPSARDGSPGPAGFTASASPLPQPSSAADGAGTGAIVAYVDTGVDVFHGDFRRSDGQTRIKYLLDLSVPGDVDDDGVLDGGCPSGDSDPCYGGTLYTEADINAALAAGWFGSRDATGHGTHGLSIAAGDDPDRPGMAPQADLVVVKATRRDETLGFESADVVNALSFVDAKAAELGRPYVVNLSLGTLWSSHDGRSLEEQAIDTLVGPGVAGKAVVVAAGNSSQNRSIRYKHLSGTSYVGLESAHALQLPAYTPLAGSGNDRVLVDLWYEGRDRHAVVVRPPAGRPDCAAVTAPYGEFADVQTPCGDVFIANMGGASPLNGDTEAIVLIDDWTGTAPASGQWTLALRGEELEADGRYHGWISDDSALGGQAPYASDGDQRLLVGKPGGAYNAITVGSFARHDPASGRFLTSWTDVTGAARTDDTAVEGDISDFSSPGGTRDGRVKPELAAPGERVVGAVSAMAYPPGVSAPPGFTTSASSIYQYRPTSWSAEGLITERSAGGGFGVLQGTSFAAPVVTGVVARLLSTSPSLDAVQVRNMLINAALVDGFVTAGGTRAVPNEPWGYGKLDTTVGTTASLPNDLRVTTDVLPEAARGRAYSMVLTASGGALPYAWSIASGALPAGLTFSAGLLSGTPTAGGEWTITFRVTDGTLLRSATRTLTLGVSAALPLQIGTVALPRGRVDRSYAETLSADGGTPPYVWSLAGGELPAGLALVSGQITGIPTAPDKAAFTLRARDAASAVALRSFTLRVLPNADNPWGPLGGGSSRMVTSIEVDPRDPEHVVLVNNGAEVFESGDGGSAWHRIDVNNILPGKPPLVYYSARRAAFDPASSDVWTAGPSAVTRYDRASSGWEFFDVCPSTGILPVDLEAADSGDVYVYALQASCLTGYSVLRSADRGASWTLAGAMPAGLDPNVDGFGDFTLSVFRKNPSYMYATRREVSSATHQSVSRVYRSASGGARWADVTAGTLDVGAVRVSQANPLDVLKASATAVEWSTDGGGTWHAVAVPVGITNGVPPQLARSDSNPAVAWVAGLSGLFKTEDGGRSWVAQQVRTSGRLVSGWFTAVAIHPSDPDTVYVGTMEGALMKSSDGGLTWELRNAGLMRQRTGSVAIDVKRPAELLAASESGPFASRTSGRKWTASKSGWLGGGGLGEALAQFRARIHPIDTDVRYAASQYRVHRSTDRGLSWSTVFSRAGSDWEIAFDVDPYASKHLLLSASSYDGTWHSQGLWTSEDAGASWKLASERGAQTFPDVRFAERDGLAYATDAAGILRSKDGGTTWQAYGTWTGIAMPRFVAAAPSNPDYVYATMQGWGQSVAYYDPRAGAWAEGSTGNDAFIFALAVHPKDHLVAYVGFQHPGTTDKKGGLMRTTDGGKTWNRLSGVLDGFSVLGITVGPAADADFQILVSTDEGGIFRSTDDGRTWTQLQDFGTVADLANVTVRHPTNSSLLFVGTEGYGVQASTDGGNTFQPRSTGLQSYDVNAIAFDPVAPSTMYAATDQGLYKSTNSGNAWTPTAQAAGRVTDVVVDTNGSTGRIIWGTVQGQGVARSLDQGASFTIFASGLASLQLTSLELEHTGTGRIIWGTTTGGDGVVCSEDDGVTWRGASGNGLSDRNVNDLELQSGNGRIIWGTGRVIWGTTDNGVFYSTDGGASWAELSLGLPAGVPVTSASIDPNTDEVLVSLYGEETGGVYRGGNVGGVWSEFNAGLDELRVRRLTNDGGREIDATTRATTFYASTSGQGVYAAELLTPAGASPRIATTSLPSGTLRQPYEQQLAASGGRSPYRWSVVAGSLPSGLTLDASGRLSGSPGAAGDCRFTVQVADAASRVDSRALSLSVADSTGSGVVPQLRIEGARWLEGNEGSSTMRFRVAASSPPLVAITVHYTTSDGTALAASDYSAAAGTLTFAARQTEQWVDVAVAGDRTVEPDETLHVSLWGAENATIALSQGLGVIVDDDAPGEVPRVQAVWHPWFAVDTLETPNVGDFNGDGRTDIITFTRQNPNAVGDVYVALSEGTRFGANAKWHDWFAISTDEQVVIGDYDGDGRDDVATWLGRSTRQVYVALSRGSGMGRETVWSDGIGVDPSDVLLAGDANGDGRQDLVCFSRTQGKVYVALSTGSGFATPTVWHGWFAVSTYERPRVADVTGDGRADIVTFATDSPTAQGDVYVAISDGSRFTDASGAPNNSTKWHDWFAVRPSEEVRVADLDGDGRDDFFTFLPPPWGQCYTVRSRGTSMADNVLWPEVVAPASTDRPFAGDVNGDGRADVIVFAQAEGKVYVSLAR